MDHEEYRRISFETWQRVAGGWDRHREYMWQATEKVGEWLIHALDPEPGDKVLELAAGLGETGLTLARVLGDDGHLILSDFSPNMIDAARRRGAELGVRNVEYRVMDAERMDLEDGSVDDVLCRFGYMLMPDPAAAFRETGRVLRDGGRVAFSVWSTPDRNPWAAVPGRLLIEMGHMPPPELDAPGIFSMSERARIEELVEGAGLELKKVHAIDVEWRFATFEDVWGFLNEVAGGISLQIERLSEEDREAVKGALQERLAPFERDGAYRVPGESLNVLAY
jgi:SAM-dependent methyltransferase